MEAIISLGEVLQYENEMLVQAFARKKKMPEEESRTLFVDLKMWLWLLGTRDASGYKFPSYPEQNIIDEYWHEFILHTVDYSRFCHHFFKHFVHHQPTPEGLYGASMALAVLDKSDFLAINKAVLARAMEEVHRALGQEVMVRWYRDLPRLYPVV